MSIFTPRTRVEEGWNYKLQDAKGIKERIDPEIKEVMELISRGDLGVPAHALKAGAFQYAKQCNSVNQEYMLCKFETQDPRRCLKYGHDVSDCAANFFKNLTDVCQNTFVKFAQCLEHNPERDYMFCRPEQLAFDKCAFENGYDKAALAVDPNPKIKTDRPEPYNPKLYKIYDNPQPLLPDWNRPFPKE